MVTDAIELLIDTVPEILRKGGNTNPIENPLPFKKSARSTDFAFDSKGSFKMESIRAQSSFH